MSGKASVLTNEQVAKIVKLSRLTVSDAEIQVLTPQLETILEHVRSLAQVNTDTVEPTSQTTGLTDVFRSDEAGQSLSVDDVLGSIDSIHNNYFVVPAVLDKDAH